MRPKKMTLEPMVLFAGRTIYKGWGEVAQRCLGDVNVAINAQTLGVLTK